RLAIELDLARIGVVRARQNLEQRRLAGAVLAPKGMDFGLADFEMDVLERKHAGEAFADPGHFQDRTRRRPREGRRRRRRAGHSGLAGGRVADEGAPRTTRLTCFAAVSSPSRILASASGRASKPMITTPLRLRALTASKAPSAMSSLAALITCGGALMPASAA